MAEDDTREGLSGVPNDDIRNTGVPMPMDEDRFQMICEDMLEDAVSYYEKEISPDNERALRYYRGKSDLVPLPHHSSQTTTEVRDLIEGMMPSLMKTFAAGDTIAVYKPSRPREEDYAEQMTNYANYIFWNDNPGWWLTYSFIKNALTQKLGIFRVFRDEKSDVTEEFYNLTGLTDEQIQLFEQDESVTSIEIVENSGAVRVTRVETESIFKICSEPPEDFIISRGANSPYDYDIIGVDRFVPVSDLVAMGFTYDEISEAGIEGHDDDDTDEKQSRVGYDTESDEGDSADPSMEQVRCAEVFIRIDKDGDGIAELHDVMMVGSSLKIFKDELATDDNFAFASPYMYGFGAIGQSVADLAMDFQDVTTAITRGMLDNIYNVVSPLKGINTRHASLEDIAEHRDRGFVRARDPNSVWNIDTPFIADKALMVLQHFDRKKQERSGVNAQSQGLDAEHLQSSTERGVDRILTISQEKIQLVAGVLANVGFKRLFEIINRMVVMHQSQKRIVEIHGKWVEIDPRPWKANYRVEVEVGLGYGTQEKKLETLLAIEARQRDILTQMGLANPYVSPAQYANTLHDLSKASGCKYSERYFIPAEMTPQAAEQFLKAQQAKPDPRMLELQMKQQQAQHDMKLKEGKLQSEVNLKQRKQMADAQLEMRDQDLDAQVELRKAGLDAELELLKITRDAGLKQRELETEAALEVEKIRLDAAVDTRLRSPTED